MITTCNPDLIEDEYTREAVKAIQEMKLDPNLLSHFPNSNQVRQEQLPPIPVRLKGIKNE